MGIRIAFLGIDGSGKSTLAKALKIELEKKGFSVRIVPFHKYIFADNLKSYFWKKIDHGRKTLDLPYRPHKHSISAFIKPIIALLDNILFYLLNQPKKNEIIIYDRFICATQIKAKSLGYHTDWIRVVWQNILPDYAFIIDIPENISNKRVSERGDPYICAPEELQIERDEYLKFAHNTKCTILDGQSNDNLAIVLKRLDYENII